jgi:hypothetical protein
LAQADVSLRHIWFYFAMSDEMQNSRDPSGALCGCAPFRALRRSALSHRLRHPFGRFGFR